MLTVERLVDWGYPLELAQQIVEAELLGSEQDEYDERDDDERYHYDSL